MGPSILALIAATLVGALVPLWAGRSQTVLHLFVAASTGLFLGILCLHLLPEALSTHGGLPAPWPGALLLGGVLVLYLLQHQVFSASGHDPHTTAGWGALLGFSLHALATGLALAAATGEWEMELALLVPLLAHKLAEGFSLAAVFSLADFSRARTLAVVALFSLATPAGLLAGDALLAHLSRAGAQGFAAFASGTFLFVAVGDLLPELFHGKGERGTRVLALVLGLAAAFVLHLLGG
ncbi:MAG TPA: hypothetical protein ENJ09_00910 [Planctomycetes bacterium]|nr:hypothetical protein [Planctomycetota bacterium]